MLVELDHVQIAAPAGCEPAARRFYGELLRLVEVVKPAALAGRGGVWFAVGGQQLHVGVDASAKFEAARRAHPALRARDVASLRALAARLGDVGIEVRWDSSIEGVARFFVDDPWGNRIEVLAAPRS